nr:DUF4340 domain-containing protein [uncultured Sphaerochaeta sp.]
MKKRSKQMIIAGAAVAVLVGIFFISSNMEKKKAQEEEAAREAEREANKVETEYKNFIPFPSEEAVRVEMDFPGRKAVFEKDGDSWTLAEPTYNTVQSAVNTTARGVLDVGSSTVVEENVADWSVYGIGSDSGRTTITSAGGETATVILGNKTPTGSGYYARTEGDNNAYMVFSYSARKLIPDVDALRDRTLPQVNSQALTYVKAEGERTIEMVPYSPFEEFSSNFSSLMLTQPYDEPCPVSMDRLGRFMEAMAATPLAKKSFIDDYASLGELGLDKDHARRLTYRDQDNNSISLLIGKAASDELYVNPSEQDGRYIGNLGPRDEYYAMLEGGEEVFTLSGAWAGMVEIDPFSLRDGFVRLIAIDDIDSFSFAVKGQLWAGRIEREGEGDDVKETYFFNDALTSEDDFKDIYQDILYIMYEGEAEPGFKLPKIAPEVTVRYIGTEEHGGSTRADFYPYDDQYYIVSVDGKDALFLVGRYQINDIVRNISAKNL